MMPRLDWRDPAAVRAFLTELRATLDDAHAVVGDMLSPPRTRELGPALHRRQYREARAKIGQLLALAMPGPRDPERGDPAGCGGAGPIACPSVPTDAATPPTITPPRWAASRRTTALPPLHCPKLHQRFPVALA